LINRLIVADARGLVEELPADVEASGSNA